MSSIQIWGQETVIPRFYTIKDGLAQNTINDMVKDNQGFVWIATKDGISRFDGYSFLNYKVSPAQFHCSVSNDFIQLLFCKSGLLWLRNSMGQVFSFNPKSHSFDMYPAPNENRGGGYISVGNILFLDNQDVWLLGSNGGAVRISQYKNQIKSFTLDASLGCGSVYNYVYSDKNKNTWILSDSCIAIMTVEDTVPRCVYTTKGSIFYDCIETPTTLLFSSSSGKIVKFDKQKKRMSEVMLDIPSDLIHVFSLTENRILVCSEYNGVYALSNDLSVLNTVSLGHIQGAWQDTNGDVWIDVEDKNGIYCYLSQNNNCTYLPWSINKEMLYSCQKNSFSFSLVDADGKLWSLPGGKNKWYSNNSLKPSILNKGIFTKSLNDKYGVNWIATETEGLQKNVTLNSSFKLYQSGDDRSMHGSVCAIMEDEKNHLWVATKDKCLKIYDKNMAFIGYVNANGGLSKSSTEFGLISKLYQGRNGEIWIGGNGQLIEMQSAGSSYRVLHYPLEKKYIKKSKITDILEDSKGRIWLTTDGEGLQLFYRDKGNVRFVNRHNDLKNIYPPTSLKTNCLFEDLKGNIWMGSNDGLTVFPVDFSSLNELRFFYYNPENTDLRSCDVTDIYMDIKGKMWFTSFEGGLFFLSNKFELGDIPEFQSHIREKDLKDISLALAVQEDGLGNLWAVTEYSVLKIDVKSGDVESFGVVNGLNHQGFLRNSFIQTTDNHIVLGTDAGFYVLNPKNIKKSDYLPSIVFTDFLLSNQKVDVNQDDSPLNGDVNTLRSIELKHNQNSFSIEFSALDFRDASHIQYAYKLEGFEDEWNYLSVGRRANYTNLSPGTYLFRVKSTNSEGNWCQNDRTIEIVVKPAFWQTTWAKLFFLLLVLVIIYGVAYYYLSFYKMKAKMNLEHEMSDMKLQFFTDISHELRTPLTLINAPVENLLANSQLEASDREQLEVVHNNTERMLNLLNKILDFRKLQGNKMTLTVKKTLMSDFLKDCCSNFMKLADNRHVNFKYIDESNGCSVWIDQEKIKTVMFNLLSNAFKFTEAEKAITVTSKVADDNFLIIVSDEGCGMPEDKLGKIFERFVTLKDTSLTNQSGTGIGLYLVKEIVEMHKGNVSVVSKEGVGSTFTISLKLGTSQYGQETEIEVSDMEQPDCNSSSELAMSDDSHLRILLIEDNNELRKFTANALRKKYNVIEAENGQVGWQKTLEAMPDFIITDIMMPLMDGIELTRQIRSNDQTSHIPVVLLTAKTDLQSKIECLKIGANDYITKPFSMIYLETRVENLIEERRRWQDKYRANLIEHNVTEKVSVPAKDDDSIGVIVEPTAKDDGFMKQVIAYIEENMSNGEISPESLADGLNMSRWNLSSKIKSLVGLTPVELIREVKINKAVKLIEQGELNMTQITYAIGMTDSRYFSRCFKQKMGMSPTEYKNKISQKK